MSACATCENPLIWSTEHGQMWCAVYGRHPTLKVVTIPPNRAVIEVLAADQANNRHPRPRHQAV